MKTSRVNQHIFASASIANGFRTDAKVNLSMGVPDLPPDKTILKEIMHTLSEDESLLNYCKPGGSLDARRNLMGIICEEQTNKNLDLILVNGAKSGVDLVVSGLLNSGDGCGILEPHWVSYSEILKLNGICPIGIGYLIKVNDILKKVDAHNLKALILNNPNNPSGFIMPPSQLELLANELFHRGVWLIIDEVYKELAFVSYERVYYPNVVYIGSLSKSMSVPGLRIGYVLGFKEYLDILLLREQHRNTGLNIVSELYCQKLTQHSYDSFTQNVRLKYKDRLDAVLEILDQNNIDYIKPDSGFYLLINLAHLQRDSVSLSEYLLDRHGVLVTDGIHYGKSFESYVRICLTVDKKSLVLSIKDIIKNENI